MPEIQISVTSGQFAARDALAHLKAELGPFSLSRNDQGTVDLVVAEVVNNIVEHAYPEGDPPGPITLQCQYTQRRLYFRVYDKGRAMPDHQLPAGKAANLNVSFMDLPEGGFGWFLIKDLAKGVNYRRLDDDTNELGFYLNLKAEIRKPT